jgi:hypothetical protein
MVGVELSLRARELCQQAALSVLAKQSLRAAMIR